MAFELINHIEDAERKHKSAIHYVIFFLFTDRLLAHLTFDFDHYVTNIKSIIIN